MAKSKMFSHISTLLSNEYRRASHEMRYLISKPTKLSDTIHDNVNT